MLPAFSSGSQVNQPSKQASDESVLDDLKLRSHLRHDSGIQANHADATSIAFNPLKLTSVFQHDSVDHTDDADVDLTDRDSETTLAPDPIVLPSGPDELPQNISSIIVSDSFDWSGTGRGRHVEFQPDEKVPLENGTFLGRGRFGEVYKSSCRGIGIAVKRRRSLSTLDIKKDREAFQKESKNLERVAGHSHVVKIIGTFTHVRVFGILLWPVAVCDLKIFMEDINCLYELYPPNGNKWDVSDVIIAQNLDSSAIQRLQALDLLLRDHNGEYSLLPMYKRLERIFGCLACSLAYLHGQDVKHNDIKPSNILITPNNIYLSDFGNSTDFSEFDISQSDDGDRGTIKYSAPEVVVFEPSGRAADIFSLGCVFLEMACVWYGVSLQKLRLWRPHRPNSFGANLAYIGNWTGLFPDGLFCREKLNWLLTDMMARDPNERPKIEEVLSRWHELQQDVTIDGRSDIRFFGECCVDVRVLL